MDKIRQLVKRHQLISFFVLTYAITWGVWIPSLTLYYREDVSWAGLFVPWGAFGPALAGILITRFVYPELSDKGRKGPLLAFFLGLVVAVLVHLLNTWLHVGSRLISAAIVGLTPIALIAAIPPAYVISSAFSRNVAVRDYLQSLIKPRGSVVYYLIPLLLFPFTFWFGSMISEALGQAPFWYIPPLVGWDAVSILSITFISQFFYGNVLGEEVGWRGFALPRLQARVSPLIASLVIALVWFVWHLPLKVINPDPISYLFYGISFIPQSIFLTWLFNRTNGSILAVGIAHVAYNVSGKVLFPVSYGQLVLEFIVAAILILVDRMWDRSTLENSLAVHRFTEQEATTG